MIVPILLMLFLVPCGLYFTGIRGLPAGKEVTFWNVMRSSSGSSSVLWAVTAAVLVVACLVYFLKERSLEKVVETTFKGASEASSLAALMMMAFAIGAMCGKDKLATGPYVASLLREDLVPWGGGPSSFLVSCLIAFCTGTSWGTIAIMLPIALPIAAKVGFLPAVAVSAVLGGAVFGDHCSPISDTTVVASMAARCEHIDHVRTQLPYALMAGTGATVLYALFGAGF